ncbi:hypothetical protein OY671_010422, partial [Metschnikowia pulcherrima]
VGWTDAVEAAWSAVSDRYDSSFDWDFVPDWIVRHIDWSDPAHPTIRPEPLPPDPDPAANSGPVAAASGAHVAFAQWDAGWIEDDDDPDTRHFDELAAQDDWDFIVENFREQVLAHYPSVWTSDGWIGREDRIVAMNRYARFGLSEYCGCIAYWVV